MEKRIRTSLLFDLYGSLITDKRSQALRLYLEEDLSLSEIAEVMGISRQGVHDSILRAETRLEEFEKALSLLAIRERLQSREEAIEQALSALTAGDTARAEQLLRAAADDKPENA